MSLKVAEKPVGTPLGTLPGSFESARTLGDIEPIRAAHNFCMNQQTRVRAEDLAARAAQLRLELERLVDDIQTLATTPNEEPTRIVAPQLLTVEEAAQALAISRSAVYQLLASGDLGSVQIGSRRRVPVTAVEAYVAQLPTAGTA